MTFIKDADTITIEDACHEQNMYDDTHDGGYD